MFPPAYQRAAGVRNPAHRLHHGAPLIRGADGAARHPYLANLSGSGVQSAQFFRRILTPPSPVGREREKKRDPRSQGAAALALGYPRSSFQDFGKTARLRPAPSST